ncbi:hypothetical protein [Prosthecobacter sp.]|uniref:hypothetical protein n=1 Tax=Prosthecobacter sp. TaxID=1965333 RepID=UPI00248707D6|nr:hypothetical protein [Prosthecobacter sp.]MDI1314641.1 hypothetical protein [Prosthecobacter sp.]
MNKFFIFPFLLLGAALSAAEPQTMFFAQENSKEYTRIALTIEGDQVTGTQNWLPKQPDGHGAHGTISGTVTDGLMRVLYEYTIEGSEQSEEEVLKLDGDKLYIGEGQLLADPKNDAHLKLQDPSKVVFKKALTRLPASEAKAGTLERKAIMDAMRVPVSADVGQDVVFTGTVRISGSWARFNGHVDPVGGKPKNEDIALEMELDFFALLQKDGKGGWKVLHKGFAGDIGVVEAAKEKYPKAPWIMFE